MKAIIRTIDPDGLPVSFETEEYKIKELLEILPKVKGYLTQAGYELTGTATAPALATTAAGTFPVRELLPDMIGGKLYWRVTGPPPRHKFGARIWEETVQAAGFDPSRAQSYDLAGWVAHYELRPKKDGEGDKEVVIKLTPPNGGTVYPDPDPDKELDQWFPRN